MNDKAALDHLAEAQGLGSYYHDYRGELRHFSAAAKTALLSAMAYDVHDDAAIEAAMLAEKRARWTKLLPSVCVQTQSPELHCELFLPATAKGEVAWRLIDESGRESNGKAQLADLEKIDSIKIAEESFIRAKLKLPGDTPLGYHRLEMSLQGSHDSAQFIVAPPRCYEPEVLAHGRRCWGLSIQLYTLRSEQNWGMGDFGDLLELIECAAPAQCALIGLNPLHALRPADPAHISPYSPSSRQFFNVLYIAVPLVPEFTECTLAQRYVRSAKQRARLEELRSQDKVDYVGVAAVKFAVLRLLHAYFRQQHLAHDTSRAQAFRSFVEQRGQALQQHALYDAMDQHFSRKVRHNWGWQSWPESYRDPASDAVRCFQQEHEEAVEFFVFLQWLVVEQLALVQSHARAHGMGIGVYGDVAVGVNPNGSESWSNQKLYLQAAAIGAPPDPLALKGQDWGIPPQNPNTLRSQAYEPFVCMLRSNMRQTGALRIDHVMALCRLWWVPRGFVATEGVYVAYPLNDLMAITALESLRNRCLVIGEDLGTVPDEMREAMERYGLYHYKVLFFEKTNDGQFKLPEFYVRPALATVTTHDLPTLKSWWESHDIELRDSLRLYPDAAAYRRVLGEREHDRRALMEALTGAGLWRWQASEALPPYSHALMRAVHLYLGLSEAALMMVQMEDLLGMSEPVNVPGTSTEYPNWQRKLSAPAKELFKRAEIQEVLYALGRARRKENPNGD